MPGDWVVVSGRIKRRGLSVIFDNPEFQREDAEGDLLHAGRIVPIYRLTAGIAAPRLRVAMREAIDRAGLAYPEYLPADLRQAEALEGIGRAIERRPLPGRPSRRAMPPCAGSPSTSSSPSSSGWSAAAASGSARRRGRCVVDDALDAEVRAALVKALSPEATVDAVDLTPDQLAATAAIRADLALPEPMLRLLQGDVGSGKTAVAAYAPGARRPERVARARSSPRPTCSRASTAATLSDLLDGVGIAVTLLTGSLSAAGTRKALEAIADGRAERGRRDARAPPGPGDVRRSRARRHRRAASLRCRAARPARGEGRRDRAARPAHDRDARSRALSGRSSTPTST